VTQQILQNAERVRVDVVCLNVQILLVLERVGHLLNELRLLLAMHVRVVTQFIHLRRVNSAVVKRVKKVGRIHQFEVKFRDHQVVLLELGEVIQIHLLRLYEAVLLLLGEVHLHVFKLLLKVLGLAAVIYALNQLANCVY
jgi:hypothetical protein